MAERMTGQELAIFIETVQMLLDDGDLLGLGVLVLREEQWDMEQAARTMLTRVDEFRRMTEQERNALGPLAMRRQLAGDLALLREALQAAGLLWAGGAGDRVAIRARPPRLRPKRRR